MIYDDEDLDSRPIGGADVPEQDINARDQTFRPRSNPMQFQDDDEQNQNEAQFRPQPQAQQQPGPMGFVNRINQQTEQNQQQRGMGGQQQRPMQPLRSRYGQPTAGATQSGGQSLQGGAPSPGGGQSQPDAASALSGLFGGSSQVYRPPSGQSGQGDAAPAPTDGGIQGIDNPSAPTSGSQNNSAQQQGIPPTSGSQGNSLQGAPKPASQSGGTAFAFGGVVDKPTRAILGESGPEAVIPLRPGMGGGNGARMRPSAIPAMGRSKLKMPALPLGRRAAVGS